MAEWLPVYPWEMIDAYTFVSFKLPAQGQHVLIAYMDGRNAWFAQIDRGYWIYDEDVGAPHWVCGRGYTPDLVFAWMPFPDFPDWYLDGEEEETEEDE